MQQRVPGVTLIEVLKHKATFDEPALKGVLLPLADALEQAHDSHKLHLSISPMTIVLQGGATPMLAPPNPETPPDAGYSAIERYSTEYKTGKWTDIYSLGAVAYRLIAGVPPPAAGARLEGEPMRSAVEIGARNYHKSLLEAVDWALKVHPLERPQTLAQWKDALIGLREGAASGGAAAGATMPITATMVRKFAEARQTNPAAPTAPPAAAPPRPAPANVTPMPPPLVEKPKPAPAPVAPPPPMAPEPPRVATPLPAQRTPVPASTLKLTPPPKIAPPPRDEPFPESPPTRPSLWSAVIAVVVIGTAIGYAWFARRPSTPAPAPAPVTQTALPPAPPVETKPAPTPKAAPATEVATAPAAAPPPPPAPVTVAPIAPVVPAPAAAPAPAPIATAPPAPQSAPPAASKLQGNWVGRASYASVLRGLDCSAEVTRTWKTSITGASADGKMLSGTFSTVLRADGDSTCPKTRYDLQIDGDFVARVQSPTALQLTTKMKTCTGDCDDNRGLLIPKTLNRTYRVSVSPKSDRLGFSDNATDFALKRSP